MNLAELIMSIYEKALEHMYDFSIQVDHENNIISIYLQPHVETLTVNDDEETDGSLMD